MRQRSPIVAVLLSTPLAISLGCSEKSASTETPAGGWSSKNQSVLGMAQSSETLVVDPAVVGDPVGEDIRRVAVDVLTQALQSPDPLVRANAIEGLQHAESPYVDDAVKIGLIDDNRGVRFVAAMLVGKLQLKSIAHLLQPLVDDPSQSVQAAALFGLKVNGYSVDLTPLARMLSTSDPEVKANAAFILGELGNASAVPVLEASLGKGLNRTSSARARLVDMQIAEALVRLGVERELEGIRAALYAPPERGELTALACQICGRLNDGRVASNLYDIANRTGEWQQSPEVRMAATMALSTIDPQRAMVGVPLEYASAERFELRAQAALTLGAIGQQVAVPTLVTLLQDDSPLVQVSAAAGLLQIPD